MSDLVDTTDFQAKGTFKKLERLAREQLSLDDHWNLLRTHLQVVVGLEEQIVDLDDSDSLTDAERWQALDLDGAPRVLLPDGVVLVVLSARVDGRDRIKTGFIYTEDEINWSSDI